jgi:hypothetical protein
VAVQQPVGAVGGVEEVVEDPVDRRPPVGAGVEPEQPEQPRRRGPRLLGDGRPPTARLARITRPTLVATGGVRADSQAGMGGLPSDFFARAADAIAASIPRAECRTIGGQSHVADPKVVAPVLERFFGQ